jgi:hypothetical protein
MGSHELFAWAGLELNPPDLSFPSSWDYRVSHQCLAATTFLMLA